MYLDFLIQKIRENKDKTAIVYKDQQYQYDDFLKGMEKWECFLNKNAIPENSIVSVRGDFTPDSIPLILSIIKKNCIYVPLSYAVKTVDNFNQIAQVEYFINLHKGVTEIKKTDYTVTHDFLLQLKQIKQPGLILFSSGSTGEPKAAVHNLVPMLEKYKNGGKALKTIAFLLFDHIGGFNTLMYILSSAGTIVALQSRSPEETCRLIEKYQVELLPTSPSFINMILYSRVYEKYDLSSLKLVTYGTEPMPEATLKKFHSLFPNIKLKQTYGLSELGIMSSKSEGSDSLWLKVGGAGYETKIVDNKLWIMAKSAMLGYLNAPSPFDEEGWFNTGDEVEQKGDYIRFLGRDSEIINVGGEKVYPAEVESVILEVEHVKDAIVYGKQNPLLGHMVCTDITLDSDYLDPSEMKKTIKKHCLERLERYKIPVKINISNKVFANDRFKRIRR